VGVLDRLTAVVVSSAEGGEEVGGAVCGGVEVSAASAVLSPPAGFSEEDCATSSLDGSSLGAATSATVSDLLPSS
jgi:hypothetical protein